MHRAKLRKWRGLRRWRLAHVPLCEIYRGQCPATLPLPVQERQHCEHRLLAKARRSQGEAHRGLPGKNLRDQTFKPWLDGGGT